MKNKIAKFIGMAALMVVSQIALADPVVVVVGSGSSVGTLTKDQVADIFLGKGGDLVPLDQAEGATRDEFSNKVIGKSATQVKAYWSKASFTGKGNPPHEVSSSAEVKKSLAANPKQIGYIEKSAVDGSVKVVLAP